MVSGVDGDDFEPLGDRILVRREGAERITPGGIIIPENAQEKPHKGEVLSVGPGALDEHGKRIPMDVAVGDTVLFGRWAGVEVKIFGDDVIILKEGDLLGRLRPRSA